MANAGEISLSKAEYAAYEEALSAVADTPL